MKRSLPLALVLQAMALTQQAHAEPATAVDQLLEQDHRLASLAQGMLGANARLCRQAMPLTGFVLHSRDQYAAGTVEALFANGPLTIALILPGSPAERAGLRQGDALAAIGERRTATLRPEGGAPLRDTAMDALAEHWPGSGPLVLSIVRDGTERQVSLQPDAGCRALVEIRTRNSLAARSDGRVIQLDWGLASTATDDEMAVILAHELAHLVLEHRRRLSEAGVVKGFFGELGRNQRLNRQVEVEADRLSVHLLANAGLDPRIAPAFWRGALARRAAGGLRISATYPSPEARAVLIEREIADYLGEVTAPSTPWHLLARRDRPFD